VRSLPYSISEGMARSVEASLSSGRAAAAVWGSVGGAAAGGGGGGGGAGAGGAGGGSAPAAAPAPARRLTAEDMHLLMECARLQTLCAGEGELSEARWQEALAMNAARVARAPAGEPASRAGVVETPTPTPGRG
jgi:hypothetical protein